MGSRQGRRLVGLPALQARCIIIIINNNNNNNNNIIIIIIIK